MKKTIANVQYDTENSELIHKFTLGFPGDSKGYEECLYKSPDGKFFLYVNGGADSPYPTENIKRISPLRAEEWLNEKSK